MARTVKSGLNTSVQGGNVKGASQGGLRIPSGTTAERDVETTAGQLRFNTTTNFLEFFLIFFYHLSLVLAIDLFVQSHPR